MTSPNVITTMNDVIALLLCMVIVCKGQDRRPDRAWYVSLNGVPDDDCGYTLVSPCRSLHYILQRADENDIILIDGAPTSNSDRIYDMCGPHGQIFSNFGVLGSLSLIGYGGAPKIGCPRTTDEPKHKKREVGEYHNEDYSRINETQNGNQNSTQHLTHFTLSNSTTYHNVSRGYEYVNEAHVNKNKTSFRYSSPQSGTSADNDVILTTARPFPETDRNCKVLLRNLELVNGVVIYGNCSVEIQNVVFENASILTPDVCNDIEIDIDNSTWRGSHICHSNNECKESQITNITCKHVTITLNNSSVYQTSFNVEGKRTTLLNVTNCLFSNDPKRTQYLGSLHLTFSAFQADIRIVNSTFENQVHPTRVQSVINLYQAALWLKSMEISPQLPLVTNSKVQILDCSFQDNERGITIVGPFANLSVINTTFVRNTAMHAGAAILILISGEEPLVIENCTFMDNIAGKFRSDYQVPDYEHEFQVVGSQVHLNTECCKGVVELVGKGGAVRVQRGRTIIINSRFVNNKARLLGGSVFVDIDGNLSVYDTYFENTPERDHALQGDILYSDGLLVINDVKLVVRTATNGLSILRHSGDHWTLDITNVWIQCPVGYDLRATNSSAYGVADIGLRRSYQLDQLSYFCESCPRNKYSLDFGYLNYTTVIPKGEKRDFAYYTLLINGSEPTPKHTGEYIHHKVQCKDCPYGGHCVQGISAVANFWGYAQNESVELQHCPRGYCCSTHVCPSINTCSTRRHGTLCGRCKPGFSEALFSSHCIPNDQCGVLWLYPFSIAVGLIYAIFLLFQADLQTFLFSKPVGFLSLFSKFKRSKKRAYMNGKLKIPTKSSSPLEDTQFIPNGGEYSNYHSNGKMDMTNCHSVNHVIEDGYESDEKEAFTDKAMFQDSGFGSGFLVIMFYYFQDALLLNVETVFIKEESKGQQLMKSILSGIFKFQLDLFELLEGVCAYENMTAVPNNLAKALIVPYVIALFVLMYIMYKFIYTLRGRSGLSLRTAEGYQHRNRKSFATRLASGFILALLFMFQKLGTTTFILLNCVPIDEKTVLFIDGEVQCYQEWQYAVMLYAIVCVTPFFLVLLFGPCMLQRGHIYLSEFFLASLCPLPFLLFWICRYMWRRKHVKARPKQLANSVIAVLVILQGPFKQNAYGLCWSGVLIGRRLVLILLFTFVTDSLIRLLCMLLACFVILLHHVHTKPYRDMRGNLAGTISAAALVVLGSINLVRAGFEAAEYVPTGPNAFLMQVFSEIENVLLLWGPMCILILIGLVFFFRISTAVASCMCSSRRARTGNRSSGAHTRQQARGERVDNSCTKQKDIQKKVRSAELK